MTHFSESNTVESMVVDLLCGPAELPRQPQDVFVEPYVREALIRLNPSLAADPNRATFPSAPRLLYTVETEVTP